jgi:hypothetical protein
LEKHFGDAIVIQCQQGQGMSNIVYSSSICLSETIDTANRLKADMKSIFIDTIVSAKAMHFRNFSGGIVWSLLTVS